MQLPIHLLFKIHLFLLRRVCIVFNIRICFIRVCSIDSITLNISLLHGYISWNYSSDNHNCVLKHVTKLSFCNSFLIGIFNWPSEASSRLLLSSRCFISTATTTLTRTNCDISTKIMKKHGARIGSTQQFDSQRSVGSQSSRNAS